MELSGFRVLKAFRAALDGRVKVRRVDGPAGLFSVWELGHGVVTVDIDELRVCFYIDDGFLDYCEWAEDHAGQRGEFSGWFDSGTEPVAQLSLADQERLRQLIESAV